ncbi:NHLP leader peptide family RiPP precursor [Flavobacterium ajazii]|uniref:NHLP leader peptide family RiPP precursor n=1 Tax=Flavobacterium ajazii TaxID=2692318 RepID=UPI0013D274E6|nr:NHLP leader peptide family RiPP precursor [Flavobacterium ajazii]
MNTNQANSEANFKKIISKSWEDESFKQELVSNPVQAIEKLFGQPIDLKGKKIVAVDQTDPSTFYINIPVNHESMELTEAELEAIAGGFKFELGWTLLCLDTSSSF